MPDLPNHVWDYIHALGHKRDLQDVIQELETKHEWMLLCDAVLGLKKEDGMMGRSRLPYTVFGVVMDAAEIARRCNTEQPRDIVKSIMRDIVEHDECAKEQLKVVRNKVDNGGSQYCFEWRDVMNRFSYLY